MKANWKRMLSILMVFALLLNTAVLMASAADAMTIQVSTVNAAPGETVQVQISLNDNPGISSLKLKVAYDDVLTLTNVEFDSAYGAYVTAPQPYVNPQTLNLISPLADISANGTFATLSFIVSEDAQDGAVAAITLAFDPDDIFNTNYDAVAVRAENGSVKIYTGIPGDIDGDKKVNNKDAIALFRYVADWDVSVDYKALDVNGDNKINNKDAITLFRYVAGWEGILLHYGAVCTHELVEHAAVDATCTEDGNTAYWVCSKCDRYYNSENAVAEVTLADTVVSALGHSWQIIPAVEPTSTTEGSTEGRQCTVCGIYDPQPQIIPPPQPEQYAITYKLYDNKEYLETVGVNNPEENKAFYTSEEGLTLEEATAPGYIFDGWYTASGDRITEIAKGETGAKTLFARWTVKPYEIQFDSPLVPVESKTYTVDKGTTLSSPVLGNYSFMGWTDENGNIVTSIPKGTTGDITLYANWTSRRNQTKPVSKLDDPIIAEDSENGQILFAYEIGTIENVPLYKIKDLPVANGIISSESETVTGSISTTDAHTIANTIANTTTNSASWTLAEDWNTSTQVSETILTQTQLTREEAETQAKTSTNTYSLNSSTGGSSTVVDSDGTSAKLTGSRAHQEQETKETGHNFDLSVDGKLSGSMGMEVGIPIEALKLGLKKEASLEIGAGVDYGKYEKNTNQETDSWSNGIELSGTTSHSQTDVKNWNTTSGYSSSNQVASSQTVSNALTEIVANTKGYGKSMSQGGSRAEEKGESISDTQSREYSSSLTYYTSQVETVTSSFTSNGETEGYYRLVTAGTIHVFAVVGYDVATSTYYVYTFNILDDETHPFIDYSRSTSAFNDYENGVLPFEVPVFVNDYVNERIISTQGLTIDINSGTVTEYSGTDSVVIVPSYVAVDNEDGTFSSVKITGIAKDAFAGNKKLVGVCLGHYITEIPDNAFEGCSSLQGIICPGVMSIGEQAFKGCVSLESFTVPEGITALGMNAFEGVGSVTVKAANASVANAAKHSGAKRITVNISSLADSLQDVVFTAPSSAEYFELQGGDNAFSNIRVQSDAAQTVINGVTFVDCTNTPIELSSESVILNRVQVQCSGFAMMLSAENTDIKLFGTINLISGNDKAVVCRNISISPLRKGVSGTLHVSGDVYICGEMEGQDYLTVANGQIIHITEEEFAKYIRGVFVVTFNANGGSTPESTRTGFYGSALGDLPIPTRDYYVFDGWFTEAEGGDLITAQTEMNSTSDLTLYAHWTLGALSDWVLASAVPEDAQIVETKYSFIHRYYTSSASSTMDGWTLYDTQRTSWGSTQGPVYSDPSNGTRNVWSETYPAGYNQITQYNYSRYKSADGTVWGPAEGTWGGKYCYVYEERGWGDKLNYISTTWSNQLGRNYDTFGIDAQNKNAWYNERSQTINGSPIYGTRWYYQEPVYTYYFYQDRNEEDVIMPSGEEYSNIQTWVRYRAK